MFVWRRARRECPLPHSRNLCQFYPAAQETPGQEWVQDLNGIHNAANKLSVSTAISGGSSQSTTIGTCLAPRLQADTLQVRGHGIYSLKEVIEKWHILVSQTPEISDVDVRSEVRVCDVSTDSTQLLDDGIQWVQKVYRDKLDPRILPIVKERSSGRDHDLGPESKRQ